MLPDALRPLARPGRGFVMVAMDQRGSLRAMFEAARGSDPDAGELRAFKVSVARVLSPAASALLLDVDEGLRPALAARAIAPGCGLIVAADRLDQPRGAPVRDTAIDTDVDPERMRALGAAALKLLVIWRDDARRRARVAMVSDFVTRCRAAGLASIVEGVVRGDGASFDREAAIVEAARELAAAGCDLYKCEVPLGGRASHDAIAERCERITAVLPCPWVVLSQGVAIDDFPAAVAAACAGGAHGALAGRAIWSDLVGSQDLEGDLATRSLPRLRELARIVDDAMATRERARVDA